MRLHKDEIQKYCKNKPNITLSIAMHEKGIDSIQSFGNNGVVITPETRAYEMGSISKVILSTFLAKCLENEVLTLDDTIDQYIDLPSGITYPSIGELATHTSGYKRNPNLFTSPLKAISYLFFSDKKQSNPLTQFDIEWLVDTVVGISQKSRKNGRFQYSNFGFSVLAYVVGKALGSAYCDYITSYINDDLSLSSTSYDSEKIAMVHGYKKDTNYGNMKWPEASAYAPAGCICSTAADMLNFAKMNLYDEKSYLTFSHQKQVSDKSFDVGLGWIIEKDNDIIWHNGRTSMFYSFLAISKSKEQAIVLFSNCISGSGLSEEKLNLSLLRSD